MHSTPWGDEAPTGLPVDVSAPGIPGALGPLGVPAVPGAGAVGASRPGPTPGVPPVVPVAPGEALTRASNEELMQAAVRATREASQAVADLRRTFEQARRAKSAPA